MTRVLLVDDDSNTLASLSRAFRLSGYEAVVCDNAERAESLVRAEQFDIILSDVVMPVKDGLAMLASLREAGVTTPVVMISGQATLDMAVRATRLGAVDFLEKPISSDKLLLTVENALKITRLEEENQQLRRRIGRFDIVWQSDPMRRLMSQVDRVAASESRVCILGETGVGKELVARAIHERSPRRERPFVTVNCAAVPADLIESELFGHEKGAFTGATGRHLGKFEQGNGGTLFLDEIGDMPLAMQAKLLRVLQDGEVERVGGAGPVVVNTRVVVATHRDLQSLVDRGAFRQDLYHRVFVLPLVVPPLRDRLDDIPVLVEHFARQVSELNGWKPKPVSRDALAALAGYTWPGNVRELHNVVERLLLLADAEVRRDDVLAVLPSHAVKQNGTAAHAWAPGPQLQLPSSGPVVAAGFAHGTLAERVEAFEREVLLDELRRHHYRIAETARVLGLERSHLYKKCQHLGIDLKQERRQAEE
jgi:two-component system, NtrC family, nitrogen regulation response regulator NtrX